MNQFPLPVGFRHPFFLIAGPCVLQTEEIAFSIATILKKLTDKYAIPFIFKSSYDKANRTALSSARGPGMEEGLKILGAVRRKLEVPVITDVHEPSQVAAVAEVADILQIPAFLCRQTSLLVEAGRSGRPVNIKKGQFLAPEDMKYAVDKVKSGGDVPVMITERGSVFGYRDLVVDYRSLKTLRSIAPVIFDGTHSVQSPGGAGGATGGNREMVPILVRSAVAAGVHGLFLEVHTDPESSPSDAANMITPETLERHLPLWMEIDRVVKQSGLVQGV